jgi:hypothetical protein
LFVRSARFDGNSGFTQFMLILHKGEYEIVIENDATYTKGSVDNKHAYDIECSLVDDPSCPSSQHSVVVKNGEDVLRSCILLAHGGATGIHQHSALIYENSCLIAVGSFLFSLQLPCLEIEWTAKVDTITCFGVYYSPTHDCFISHGELDISRVDHGGKILWQAGGKDIFTNGFELHDDHIEAVDWDNERYRINIDTGTI